MAFCLICYVKSHQVSQKDQNSDIVRKDTRYKKSSFHGITQKPIAVGNKSEGIAMNIWLATSHSNAFVSIL